MPRARSSTTGSEIDCGDGLKAGLENFVADELGNLQLPPRIRNRLHQLFRGIEREFENLYLENQELRDKLALLDVDDLDNDNLEAIGAVDPKLASTSSGGKKSVSSHFSQRLKTTYRAGTNRIVSSFTKPLSGAAGGNTAPPYYFLRNFESHDDGVWEVNVGVINGCSLLASASADQTVKISLVESGQCLYNYQGHSGSVNSVRFHPEENLILSASGDTTAQIWKIPPGLFEEYQSIENVIPADLVLDTIEEGTEISTVASENFGEFNELPPNIDHNMASQPLLTLTGHVSTVSAAEWVSTNQIITGSWDKKAFLWNAETGQLIEEIKERDEITNVAALSVGVGVTYKDGSFAIWDPKAAPGQALSVCTGHTRRVTSIQSLPSISGAFDSDLILTSSDDRMMKIWDLKNMNSPVLIFKTDAPVNRVRISRDGIIAAPLDNKHVRFYHVNGTRLGRLPTRCGHSRMVCSVCWNEEIGSNHPNLISSGFDGKVIGWNVSTIGLAGAFNSLIEPTLTSAQVPVVASRANATTSV